MNLKPQIPRKILLSSVLFFIVIHSFSQVAPLTKGPGGVVSGLRLWLRSDLLDGTNTVADNTAVGTWSTQARGSDAIKPTNTGAPVYKNNALDNINFNSVVDFTNNYNTAPQVYTDNDNTRQYLRGTTGFYSQDMFVVLIPDAPITSSVASNDIFCGDYQPATQETDATGIGYGAYTARFSGEVLTYAIGTTSGTPPTATGFGVANVSSTAVYNSVGIINARNNASITGQELYFNANDQVNTINEPSSFINVSNSQYWIGRSEGWSGSLDARVGEIITFDTRLTNIQRSNVQSYLAIKYGITLGINGMSIDYTDSAGNVIWDVDTGVPAEDVFNYDIAGIGRDDNSALNQKQSKSVNSLPTPTTADDITIGLTTISATNSANTSTFGADKEFLTWGNNNGTLNAQTPVVVNMSKGILPLGSLITNVQFVSIGRTWKIKETVVTPGVDDVPSCKVSIPTTMLSTTLTPPGSYLMFISDTPNFDPTADYRIMTEVGSNLETNYDFDGTKYITFGFAPEITTVRSINFDGVQDYVDMEDALDLNASEFTISAWIKRELGSINTSILSKRDATYTEGYDFKINNSGNLEMLWNGGAQSVTSSTVIPQDKWHHVAVIYKSGTATLYIDGVADGTASSLSAPVATTESFYIAAAGKGTPTAFFKGNIDEVRVWDVALTVDQLHYIMNQEIIDSSVSTLPLIRGNIIPTTITKNEISSIPWAKLAGYYPMSVYTYTNTNDMSGNGHQGALRNLDTVDWQTAPLPYQSTIDGNWDTAATWLNNTVQDLPNGKSIVDGITPIDWNIVETNNHLNTTRNINVLGLKVNTNELSVNADNSLTISHYLLINGVVDLDGESQLIQTTGSDFDIASTGYLERDQQGEGNKFRYNDWSSPVYTANDGKNYTTVQAALRDGTNPASPGTINYTTGYDGSLSPLTLSTYWMYKYANLPDGSYSSWDHIGNTGKIYAGEGFLMKGPDNPGALDQNYVFEGKPNNGDINLTVAAGNDYLVGNPYPSAIDAYQFIDDNVNTITGPLYFWDHYGGDTHNLAGYQAGYATLTKSGGVVASAHSLVDQTVPKGTTIPGRYIPISQGFFVVGDVDGGTIQFKNSQRIFVKEAVGTSVFMKTAKGKGNKPTSKTSNNQIVDTRPKFRIGFKAPKIDHRQLLLTIDKNTTDGIDWGYEGEIYEIFGDDMYWMIGDKKYVIQATNEVSADKEIPLGIKLSESGNITIKVDDLENVDEKTELYIKDKLTGETYNIKNQSFEINLEAGDYTNRFVLAFQPRLKTIEETTLSDGINVVLDQQNSEIKVIKIVDTEINSINLYNYLGQLINTWSKGLNKRLVYLPTNTSTGVYILRINTTNGSISKKIIIE